MFISTYIAWIIIAALIGTLIYFETRLGEYKGEWFCEFTNSCSKPLPETKLQALNELTEIGCFQTQEVIWKKIVLGAVIGAVLFSLLWSLIQKDKLELWKIFVLVAGTGSIGQLLMHNFYYSHGPIFRNSNRSRRLRTFLEECCSSIELESQVH